MSSPPVPFELEALSSAVRYQKWLLELCTPYLGTRILELGSGIGNMSRHLPQGERLILSESSPEMLEILKARIPPRPNQSIVLLDNEKPALETLAGENLDTVVSFNVLEHVRDDVALLRDLLLILSSSTAKGSRRLVTLVPAHQWAFGEVDKSYGHFRRYSAHSYTSALRDAGAKGLPGSLSFRYLNIPALLGWWLNSKVLRRDRLGEFTISAFEKLIPLLRPIDNFLHEPLGLPFGNSLIAVYELPETPRT